MSSSLGLVRRGKKKHIEAPVAIHDALRELVDSKSSYTEELSRRAGQMKMLSEMAQIMRALMIRAETGALSQSALDSTVPPKVKQLAPKGTEASFEYVRTTLQMIRPIVVKLYVENHSLTKKIRTIESELSTESGTHQSYPVDHGSVPLTLAQLSPVLGEMGLCDSELEDMEEVTEESTSKN